MPLFFCRLFFFFYHPGIPVTLLTGSSSKIGCRRSHYAYTQADSCEQTARFRKCKLQNIKLSVKLVFFLPKSYAVCNVQAALSIFTKNFYPFVPNLIQVFQDLYIFLVRLNVSQSLITKLSYSATKSTLRNHGHNYDKNL